MDDPSLSIDPALLPTWLADLGYRVSFREDGFVDCLVCSGLERWLGHGVDRDSALAHAVAQMFPSRAARELVEAALDRVAAAPPEPQQPADANPVEPDARTDEPPVDAAQEAVEAEPAEPPPSPDLPPPRRAAEARPTIVPREPVPTMAVEEALSELEILQELIASERGEVALMVPDRQRLIMLGWVCRARWFEEATEDHPAVVDRVATIARQLGALSKVWWPGSVLALRRDSLPADVGRELGIAVDQRPRSWEQAAEAVEAHLHAVEKGEEASGCDEYGWSDAACLEPAPLKPDAQLVELRRQIERIAGNVQEPPPAMVLPSLRNPSPDDVKLYVSWLERARWLRGFISDFEGWGAVMGRLRWIAGHVSRRDDKRLDELVNPAWRPRRTWADALGQDPEAKRRKRRKRALLQGRPRAGTEVARADLLEWLVQAFEVLDDQRIAALLSAFAPVVVTFSADEIAGGDRRLRRRLRKVQDILSKLDAEEADRLAAEVETPDDEEVEEDDAFDGGEGDGDDPAERLLGAVSLHTRGRAALFVSNRKDPLLEQTLRDTFHFAELAWCEGSPRRVQTMSERVAAGTYDFVLSATGFQSHSVDGHMVRACRRAKASYVRVHRGRRLACILALARELGIGEAGGQPGAEAEGRALAANG